MVTASSPDLPPSKLTAPGRDRLAQEWRKASNRLDGDPEGAVTSSRTLLESTCKHILEASRLSYPDSADLPKLYSLVAQHLGISAAGDVSRINKQFFGATHTIVQSIGELRNKAGDAHGKGAQSMNVSSAQAVLAVSLASAVSEFLISSYDSYVAAHERLTPEGEAVLIFEKATVWRLIDHAQNAPKSLKSFGQKRATPSLWLVGDAGIYLMSNGSPPLLHNGKTAKPESAEGKLRLTAYAQGCGPGDPVDDWWPIHNAVAGGDDFCRVIKLSLARAAAESARSTVIVVAGRESYAIASDVEFAAAEGEIPL